MYTDAIAVRASRRRRGDGFAFANRISSSASDSGGAWASQSPSHQAPSRSCAGRRSSPSPSRYHLGPLRGSRVGSGPGDPGGAVVAGLVGNGGVPEPNDVILPGRLGDLVTHLADDPVGVLALDPLLHRGRW